MKIIYLHGLDSDPTATKAQITKTYANKHNIAIDIPDLNKPPKQVIDTIMPLITPNSVLIGSSLGGYFANLLSDMTGVACILLNPSIRPDVSFERFLAQQNQQNLQPDTPIYTTKGNWQIVYGDLAWFCQHPLTVKYPHKIHVLLKMGDELLNPQETQAFYKQKGVQVFAFAGGDHRISDYQDYIAKVMTWAKQLADNSCHKMS